MNDTPDDIPDESLPEPLRQALARLNGRDVSVPAEVDDWILTSAKADYARRRRAWFRIGRAGVAVAATAAVVFLTIRLGLPPEQPKSTVAALTKAGTKSVANDVNGDGRLDVLDALIVARAVRAGGPLDPAWDVNGDGRVDENDVDCLARAAVRVDGGGPQ